VHVAHILLTTKAQADAILARVRANPNSFAALAGQYSQDPSTRSAGGDLGQVGRSRLDPAFAQAVFAAKPGSYLEVKSSVGWHVVHVIAHPIESITAATTELRASILQNLSQQRVATLLDSIATQLHITVNPRYGKWSTKDRAVNAPPDDLSKPRATPTPAPTLPTGTGPPSG
jgi:parvulin-like peptidyl-prolyl isomerase